MGGSFGAATCTEEIEEDDEEAEDVE